jgi:hypothetical protein
MNNETRSKRQEYPVRMSTDLGRGAASESAFRKTRKIGEHREKGECLERHSPSMSHDCHIMETAGSNQALHARDAKHLA